MREDGRSRATTAAVVLGALLAAVAVGWWAVPKAVHWAVTQRLIEERAPVLGEGVDTQVLADDVAAVQLALNNVRYQLDTQADLTTTDQLRTAAQRLRSHLPADKADLDQLSRVSWLSTAVDKAAAEAISPDGDRNLLLQLVSAAEQRVQSAVNELGRLNKAARDAR